MNINSRPYSVEQSTTTVSTTTKQTDDGLKDVGLIVGLVAGLVTAVILITSILLGYYLYQGKVEATTIEPTQQTQVVQPTQEEQPSSTPATQISVSDFEKISFPPVLAFPSTPANLAHVTTYLNPSPPKSEMELIPFN